MRIESRLEILKGRYNTENLGVDKRIILKCMLKLQGLGRGLD